jgi:hypothetical protein
MRVFDLYVGLTLLLSAGAGIAAQLALADARRSEAIAVADASIKQRGTRQLAPDSRGATIAAPLAARTITPAPVVEPGDEMFIGTGDGSNGFWVRP